MRAPVADRGRGLGFSMTPMIDVVFLLIIFFLVSSHLARQEFEEQLALPHAASAADEQPDGGGRVTVNVLPDGTLRLSGREVDVEQLARQLRAESASQRGGARVRIRADRRVNFEAVGPVLAACAEAGVWEIDFAVIKGNRENSGNSRIRGSGGPGRP